MSICDKKVFKEIYFNWLSPIQRFLQSKGLDMNQAADIAQESFIRLWQNCAKVTSEKSKSYLFTVANRLFIDEKRKEQTRIRLTPLIKEQDNTDGQYQLEMKEFKAKLEEAINTMTPASKEVFILYRFNEMSYKEIATQLEISVKAVEKRMGKALKHLLEQKIKLRR